MTRWFEDIVIDQQFPLGSHAFTADDIRRFATRYDPQMLDITPATASGWHVASVGHRKMVDTLDAERERLVALGRSPGVSGPSPGVNTMTFDAPVRAGDTVSYTLAVTGKRHSASIPGWGLLFNAVEGTNQRSERVYRAEVVGFSKLRDYQMPLRLKLLQALTSLPLIASLLGKHP